MSIGRCPETVDRSPVKSRVAGSPGPSRVDFGGPVTSTECHEEGPPRWHPSPCAATWHAHPDTGRSMTGMTIRTFLADGTPLGLRITEKSNWTGRGFDFARTDWPRARVRDDFGKPGVYVLIGIQGDGNPRVYIGEAGELRSRINQHFSGPGAKGFLYPGCRLHQQGREPQQGARPTSRGTLRRPGPRCKACQRRERQAARDTGRVET